MCCDNGPTKRQECGPNSLLKTGVTVSPVFVATGE